MKDHKRLIRLIRMVVVLALVVFFLPRLFFALVVMPVTVHRLNQRLPGHLQIQSCSLHWMDGVYCRDITYTDTVHNFRVHLPGMHTDKGLLPLLLAPQYLGTAVTSGAVLTILAPQDQNTTEPKQPRQSTGTDDASRSWWERHDLRLSITDSMIVAETGRASVPAVVTDQLHLQGDLTSGTINYTLDSRGGLQTDSHLHAQGYLNLPNTGQPFLQSLISQATLEVKDLEIAPLVHLAAAYVQQLPKGTGRLDASCRLQMQGMTQFNIEGTSHLHGLELSGGVLGADHPRLEQADFSFQGSRSPGTGWQLTQMDLQSPLVRFSAQGQLDREHLNFQGKGEVDLAGLAHALPKTLALHPQTVVNQGVLGFDLTASGKPGQSLFAVNCSTDRVALTRNGHLYVWESPFTLHADGTGQGADLRLAHVQARAPFAELDGQQGRNGDFTLESRVNLESFFTELNKIFQLQFRAQGDASCKISGRYLQPDQLQVITQLTVNQFSFARGDNPWLPFYPLTLHGEIVGSPYTFRKTGLDSFSLDFSAGPGSLILKADPLPPTDTGTLATGPQNLQMRVQGDLTHLFSWGRQLGLLPEDWQAQGQLEITGSGRWRQNELYLKQVEGTIKPCIITAGQKTLLQESQANLSLDGGPLSLSRIHVGKLRVVQPGEKLAASAPETAFVRLSLWPFSLNFNHLRMQAPKGVFDLLAVLGSQQNASVGEHFTLRGVCDLQWLMPWARLRNWFDDATDFSGQSTFSWNWQFARAGKPAQQQYDINVKDFAVTYAYRPMFADPDAHLALQLSSADENTEVRKVTQLALHTSLFDFSGNGQVHVQQHPPLLELQGDLRIAADQVGAFLSNLVPGTVKVQKTGTMQAIGSLPLRLPVDISQLTLMGNMPLEQMSYLGFTLPSVTVPVELDRGTLHLGIQGPLQGGGEVDLHPEWSYQNDLYVLSLVRGTQAMRDVPLFGGMANKLLASLVPMNCLLRSQGRVNFSDLRFVWPLGQNMDMPDYAVTMDFQQAQFKAAGALQSLLTFAGLGNVPLTFIAEPVTCKRVSGVTTCSPLHLQVGARDVSLSGSQQADGTLSCQVLLPATGQLGKAVDLDVDGKGVAATTISGTCSSARFDGQSLLQGMVAAYAASSEIVPQQTLPMLLTPKKGLPKQRRGHRK